MACNEKKPNCLKDLPHNGPKIYLKVSKQESPYKRRQESPYNLDHQESPNNGIRTEKGH